MHELTKEEERKSMGLCPICGRDSLREVKA
jgi:hypothetical protein